MNFRVKCKNSQLLILKFILYIVFYLFGVMSKRPGKNVESGYLKKPRLDFPKTNESEPKKAIENDDIWGEDFAEDEVLQCDDIVSQACSQEVNVSTINLDFPGSSRAMRHHNVLPEPSTSNGSYTSFAMPQISNNPQYNPSLKYQNFKQDQLPKASQKLASSDNIRGIVDDDISLDEFKKNLRAKDNLNSTFQATQGNENDHESVQGKLKKLEDDYNKLLDELRLKEGETIHLRQQLQRIQTKAEKESIEKIRLIEDQANSFRSEINTLYKEKENMKTQYELQTLQMNNITERCKILEKGSIKYTNPQSISATDSLKNRTPSRLQSISKVKMCETSNQTEKINREIFQLKSPIVYYPFKRMPQAIFEPSMPEKLIVDIENVEKRGKRIFPILEDEKMFRIFENSNIVKPKVTMINGKKLNVEFFQSDIASIINKTESEMNSTEVTVIINKIVATLRELILNIVSVLQTVTTLLNNDDIIDVNDLYLSNFYNTAINYNRNFCDAKEWHDKERGIEARRTLGVLCFIAKESDYLCKYIAGECELHVQNDEVYNRYSKQMIQYNEWSTLKQHKYEILEMILQFVTAINYVRRAHQFTGFICAISRILKVVQNKIGFNNTGINYVTKIFKELIFSRPLPQCLSSMTEMMAEFSKSQIFVHQITDGPNKSPLSMIKNILTFADNACVLEIYIQQLKNFRFDDVTMINITHALMTFTDRGYRSKTIPWPYETDTKCYCSALLLNGEKSQNLDDNFWLQLRNKQHDLLKVGIRFLSYLAKRDPEVIVKSVDLENAFPLFMEHISRVEDLKLHEIEEEALALIKLTFTLTFDKPATTTNVTRDGSKLFETMSAFDEKSMPTPSSSGWFNFDSNRDEYRSMTQMFKSKLQI